jgi:hypothetical protein
MSKIFITLLVLAGCGVTAKSGIQNCYTVSIDNSLTFITSACTADGTITAVLNDPNSSDTVYFYLTDPYSTTLVMPGAFMSGEFRATFSGLVGAVYALTAVAVNSEGICCLTPEIPVVLVQENSCDDTLAVVGIADYYLLGSVCPCMNNACPNYDIRGVFPSQQLLNAFVTFQLQYGWQCNDTPVATCGVSLVSTNFPDTTAAAVGPLGVPCNPPPIMNTTSSQGGGFIDPSAFPLVISWTPPSSPFACDGSIAVTSTVGVQNKSVIYYLTPFGSSTSQTQYDNTGDGVEFKHLPAGNYSVNGVLVAGPASSISFANGVSLTASGTSELSICSVTNQCGNYVDLVAIPTSQGTSCFIQQFTWLFSPDGKEVGCIVGRGPLFHATTPGHYTVVASLPNFARVCLASQPVEVTLSPCTSCSCSAEITVSSQDVCLCAGTDLTLQVSALSSAGGTAQLFVTGPGCFSFTGSIPLDGTSVSVPVTSYATALNMGCYFALVIDANGCIGSNFTVPIRVVVEPCCP